MPRPSLVLALLGLAACTVPVTPAAPTTLATVSTLAPTPEEAAARFNTCVEDAGADLPDLILDSTGRPGLSLLAIGVDLLEPSVREALVRCSRLLTDSGALEFEGELRNRVMGALREFSQCMREEGVLAFPDPVSDFSGTGDPYPLDDVLRGAPGFADAAGACASRLAAR